MNEWRVCASASPGFTLLHEGYQASHT